MREANQASEMGYRKQKNILRERETYWITTRGDVYKTTCVEHSIM